MSNSPTILEQLIHSPKLSLYVEKMRNVLIEEKKRRTEFYDTVSEEKKMEFINGEVIVHSPVRLEHSDASERLFVLIKTYVELYKLGYVGHEKLMVSLTRNDYEPDICFWSSAKSKKFKSKQMHFPPPDFIGEVISPTTEENDRGVKFEDYSAHGVKEYWIIDPETQIVEQYILRGEEYHLNIKSDSGVIKSVVISGFEIPIKAIFNGEENLKTLRTIIK